LDRFRLRAIVNPDNLRNQSRVRTLWTGGALFEAIEFENGRILNGRMSEYQVPRFSNVPVLETVLVDRKTCFGRRVSVRWLGCASHRNAIFGATGVRLRSLPMVRMGEGELDQLKPEQNRKRTYPALVSFNLQAKKHYCVTLPAEASRDNMSDRCGTRRKNLLASASESAHFGSKVRIIHVTKIEATNEGALVATPVFHELPDMNVPDWLALSLAKLHPPIPRQFHQTSAPWLQPAHLSGTATVQFSVTCLIAYSRAIVSLASQ